MRKGSFKGKVKTGRERKGSSSFKFDKSSSKELSKLVESKLKGVYQSGTIRKRIYSKSIAGNQSVYGEIVTKQNGDFFREWDPKRSKLGAAILKGANQLGIMPDKSVLYLGASNGTTVSHVSDVIGEGGVVFALDFAHRVMRDLIFLSETRPNIFPIFASAAEVDSFGPMIFPVDVVFQDIATRLQLDIFIKNCDAFLKDTGFGIFVVKARSIDISKKPKQIFKEVRSSLEKLYNIVDYRDLDPYEKDHALFVIKKK